MQERGPEGQVVVTLHGVPVGKGRARFVRSTGHAYTPARTANYEGELRAAGAEAMAGRPPIDAPLVVRVEAYLPIPASWSRKKHAQALAGLLRPTTRPDCDNYLKAALDGLNAVVFRDDSLVVDSRIIKAYSDRPRLVVTVEAA